MYMKKTLAYQQDESAGQIDVFLQDAQDQMQVQL